MYISKKLLLIIGGLVLLSGAGIAVTHIFNTPRETVAITNQKKSSQIDAAKKKQLVEDNSSSTGSAASKPDQAASSSPTTYKAPDSADSIKISTSQNGGTVTISTQLYGYSDGTCNLVVTNASKSFSSTANVIYQSQFSTCAGFTIPVSQLGSGNWNIQLSVTSQGVTNTNKATIEVQP